MRVKLEVEVLIYAPDPPRTESEALRQFTHTLKSMEIVQGRIEDVKVISQGNESGSARDSSPTTGNESSDSRLK